MSKGLGKLQRLILDNLDAAKDSKHHYTRGPDGWTRGHGQVLVLGMTLELHENLYDLRGTVRFMAEKFGGLEEKSEYTCGFKKVRPSFQVSFSRAVASLVRRGLLIPVDTGRECRFVRRASAEFPVALKL